MILWSNKYNTSTFPLLINLQWCYIEHTGSISINLLKNLHGCNIISFWETHLPSFHVDVEILNINIETSSVTFALLFTHSTLNTFLKEMQIYLTFKVICIKDILTEYGEEFDDEEDSYDDLVHFIIKNLIILSN